ncbi:MAG: sulfatase [Bordetella sp. SCN 67-23]|nr:sulfatase-like hydrolase/transferase [Burkholderiales bacterium]ODS72413.1 MAG: sulfatase [Bordetella sp. SCN 67-23]ODU83521.1 MAG: sulfatase [Bordetella sp. SCN 68-11]OJW94722.1 MAG: sulfatase [Burkholderiales bacterium 67-32]
MKPNFLVFIVDQLCASHLGCYGNDRIDTSNIDALARAGWRAEDCNVATPICMPNRASLLTGRMPSVHGVRHNGIPLSLGARTFVDALREAGYMTSLTGKSHLQNMTAKPPLPVPGAPRWPLDAELGFPGDYRQECVATWHGNEGAAVTTPFYGFDRVELAIEHGDQAEGDYRRWLRANHPELADRVGPGHAIPAPEYVLTSVGQAWRSRLPEACHPTAWIADRTIERLREAKEAGRPFFAYCSFPDPHHPYTPPGRYWDMYKPEEVELPASFHSQDPPPHLRWLREQRDRGQAVKHTMACFAATEREAREAIALGQGSLSFIDAQIGRVLAQLRALGLEDDTVVVFTSDHGEFAGDHQLLFKGSLHYRSLIRTPLVWRDPAGQAGGVHRGLLSTIDIAPTILERAGVPAYNGIQGRSFLAGAQGRETDGAGRDAVVIEEDGQRIYFGFDAPVRMRTLLTPGHRLSVYRGVEWGELYDRAADPHEARNLWHDPAASALKAGLMERLAREMLDLMETNPAPTAVA